MTQRDFKIELAAWTTALGICVAHWVPSALQGGSAQVNNARITSEDHQLTQQDLIEGRLLLLAAGIRTSYL